MFAVVVADVHVHPHREFNESDVTGESWRVKRSIDALEQALAAAREAKCPLFIAGDLLHDKRGVPTEVIHPLLMLFDHFSDVPVRFLVGNHERPDHFSRTNTLVWLADRTAERSQTHCVVDRPTIECFNHLGFEVAVCFLPWSATLRADASILNDLLVAFAKVNPNTPRVLIGHGCVDGATADNGVRLSGEITRDELNLSAYNLALFGDIHKAQPIAGNAHYVGALLQQRASEAANPQGYTTITPQLTSLFHPLTNIPAFGRSNDIKQVGKVEDPDTGEVWMMKPSAEAVAASLAEKLPEVRMAMNLGDLRSMVQSYVAQFPPEDGFTFEQVWAAIEQEDAR